MKVCDLVSIGEVCATCDTLTTITLSVLLSEEETYRVFFERENSAEFLMQKLKECFVMENENESN